MRPRPDAYPRVAIGLASRAGRRPDNQDFVAAYHGEGAERVTHGVVAALADGMGGAKGGRVAAELACRSFIEGYYGLPATLGVAVAADRALSSFNTWLHQMAAKDPNMTGAATTFSALVIRDRFAHALHVGDTRIWRLRGDELVQLSTDHALSRPGREHILYRAVGIEQTVRLDYAVLSLEAHDRLLITSDGVHGVLAAQALKDLLGRRGAPDRDAAAIVDSAIRSGSDDNASAVVVEIVSLPDPDHGGLAGLAAGLPLLAPPALGANIDGFVIERLLADGEHTRTYAARGGVSGEDRFILKFPKPGALPEHLAREGFVRELLIGARVASPYLAEVVQLPPDRQTQIYTVMPFYDGETLDALLRRGPFAYDAGLFVAAKLARAVAALHRMAVVHRDIKPENVLVDEQGGLRLLDLSSASLPNLEDPVGADTPGSQGYIAPEIYAGGRGTEASDQFALGATLYRLFTNRFPFEDLQALRRPGFDSPADPAVLRRDMPAWLAYALRRSVQVRPEDRYESVGELLHILELGSAKATPRPPRPSLMERHPVLLWQLIALMFAILFLVSLARK